MGSGSGWAYSVGASPSGTACTWKCDAGYSQNGTIGCSAATYVDDVFSTYLYAGNGGTQTINNGIDLAGNGGMVWLKNRLSAYENVISDTVRGAGLKLMTNSVGAQVSTPESVSSFLSSGFSLNTAGSAVNGSSNYVSWTFRKAPKFFDVVTWTGDGTNDRVLTHSLGIQPGMVIVKRTTGGTENWPVWHRSVSSGSAGNLFLNLTNALGGAKIRDADATTFTLGTSDTTHNALGSTYVAYVFAHDPAPDGIIQAGSFTTDASGNASVNLGWEPQFLMIKDIAAGSARSWYTVDASRGYSI